MAASVGYFTEQNPFVTQGNQHSERAINIIICGHFAANQYLDVEFNREVHKDFTMADRNYQQLKYSQPCDKQGY